MQIVDMLSAATIVALGAAYKQMPEDTPAHRRRAKRYLAELTAKQTLVQGSLAGDPQTGGRVFIRAQ